eukprot:GHRQ01003810.1.p1 GENE.GHRQ01003810.1~~GHRQ01003810.1.p1  ORF type:complete len:199 (+),score=51.50 GHRQ01003810.1:129-725(+)
MVIGLHTQTSSLSLSRCTRARRPAPAQLHVKSKPCTRTGPYRTQVAQSFDTSTATPPTAGSARSSALPAADAAASAAFLVDQQQLSRVAASSGGSSTSSYAESSYAEGEEQLHQQAEVPKDVLREFEHKLEADLQSVAVTVTAVTGVIIYWRGVWSLLDYMMGDSLFGDICCIIVGLTIVLAIRLSGVKVASSFWPSG